LVAKLLFIPGIYVQLEILLIFSALSRHFTYNLNFCSYRIKGLGDVVSEGLADVGITQPAQGI